MATARQALSPDRYLGRVIAVSRVATWGGMAVGALIGVLLADQIGVRPTIAVAAALPLLGFVYLLLSPFSRLRRLDSPADAACSTAC
jgi:predicted MFS family arabinose efflux permease